MMMRLLRSLPRTGCTKSALGRGVGWVGLLVVIARAIGVNEPEDLPVRDTSFLPLDLIRGLKKLGGEER